MKAAIIFIAAVVIGLAVFAIKHCTLRHEQHAGVVIDKVYTPSSTHTGTGTAVGANGQVGIVTTTSSESEKWTVLVQVDSDTRAIQTTAAKWARANKGDKVMVDFGYGWHTGMLWDVTLL